MFTFYVASSVCLSVQHTLVCLYHANVSLQFFLNSFTKHYSSMPQGLLNIKIENRNGMAYHMNLQLDLGTLNRL